MLTVRNVFGGSCERIAIPSARARLCSAALSPHSSAAANHRSGAARHGPLKRLSIS